MTIDKISTHPIVSNDLQTTQTNTVDRTAFTLKEQQQNTNHKLEQYGVEKKEDVKEAVEKLNSFLEPVRRNLKFELHEKLDKYYVTVIDSNTKEVIKEIPPRKILDMYAAMAEFMGLLVDRKI